MHKTKCLHWYVLIKQNIIKYISDSIGVIYIFINIIQQFSLIHTYYIVYTTWYTCLCCSCYNATSRPSRSQKGRSLNVKAPWEQCSQILSKPFIIDFTKNKVHAILPIYFVLIENKCTLYNTYIEWENVLEQKKNRIYTKKSISLYLKTNEIFFGKKYCIACGGCNLLTRIAVTDGFNYFQEN